MYILRVTKLVKFGIQNVPTHPSSPTIITLKVTPMRKNDVMNLTCVLERHRNTYCCCADVTVSFNVSLGMLHYLQRAFRWPRWDMTGVTGSSWNKQRGLKALGEGSGWWGGPGRRQSAGVADCNAHVEAWRWGREERHTRTERDERAEGKHFFIRKRERAEKKQTRMTEMC